MIKSQKALKAALEHGATFSLLARGSGFAWQVTETAERVSLGAIRKAAEKGVVQPMQRDLCGDPMQYGPA